MFEKIHLHPNYVRIAGKLLPCLADILPQFWAVSFCILLWSSVVIVHGISVFFASFFRNISKTAETILIKQNWAKLRHLSLQKSPNK